MPIQVQCPGCGRQFQAADRLAGKRAKCPHCSAAISVPDGSARQTARATSAERPSEPAAAGPASSGQEAAWYVQTGDGRQHGPMTQAQVERLVSSGRMNIFCRLRHQTWSQWKWAEDLFPELAQSDQSASTGDDAQQAAPVVPPPLPPSGESTAPRPRVVACPDCGNTVSTRAHQCPHCGCPAPLVAGQTVAAQASPSGEGPAATAELLPESGAGRKPGILGSKWGSALIVHAAAALLLIAVVGLGVGWWLWKSHPFLGRYESEAEALLDDLLVPTELPAVSPDKTPAVSPDGLPDERQAAIQQAAAEVATRLDGEFRTAQSAKKLIEQTQFSADLIKALAQGDLDAIPDTLPTELAPENSTSYRSLYDSLYSECLAYLEENVPRKQFSKRAVRDAARRWEEGKRALLERQLTETLEKHLAPSRQPR